MKRAFKAKFFLILKGLSVEKICLRPKSAPLKIYHIKVYYSKRIHKKTLNNLSPNTLF